MELIDYKAKLDEISEEVRKKKLRLNRDYALSHNTVKIGDMVTDHIGSVCVESISVFNDRPPSCIYTGICYTKAGKPFKSKEKRSLYQINIS